MKKPVQKITHLLSSNYLGFVGISIIPLLVLAYLSDLFRVFFTNFPDYMARSVYYVGFQLRKNNHDLSSTRHLWSTARDMYPLSGHLWVELASLYKYELHDDEVARQVLEACTRSDVQFHGYPASQCRKVLNHFDELSVPGTLLPNVMKGL